MNWLVLAAGVVLVVSFAWPVSGDSGADKFERADCIAGAELEWPPGQQDKIKTINKIAEADPVAHQYPTAGLSVRDSERIYVIFHRDCERRRLMMREIMERYERAVFGFPPYRIINKNIEPSPNTIQVYGGYWSDGQARRDQAD